MHICSCQSLHEPKLRVTEGWAFGGLLLWQSQQHSKDDAEFSSLISSSNLSRRKVCEASYSTKQNQNQPATNSSKYSLAHELTGLRHVCI